MPAKPALSPTPAPENHENFTQLCRALSFTQRFTLFFARCNLPAQRDDLIARVGLHLGTPHHLVRIDLSRDENPMVRLLTEGATSPPPSSLHLCGLEHQLPQDDPHPPVLGRLNLAREHLRNLPCPVIIWLRDEALTRVAQGAPDFWAWRSDVFEFLPEPTWAEQVYRQPRGGTLAWGELPPAQKSHRILTLEGLLADYRELGDSPAERNIRADLLLELGKLYTRSYRMDAAASHFAEALTLYRGGGDKGGEANTLRAIGDVQYFQKDTDAARASYAAALSLYRVVGARLGEAHTLAGQGRLALGSGDEDSAKRLLDQALQIYQRIGSRYNIPATIGNYGWALQRQGKIAAARPYFLRAADLFAEMGLADYAERHRRAATET